MPGTAFHGALELVLYARNFTHGFSLLGKSVAHHLRCCRTHPQKNLKRYWMPAVKSIQRCRLGIQHYIASQAQVQPAVLHQVADSPKSIGPHTEVASS